MYQLQLQEQLKLNSFRIHAKQLVLKENSLLSYKKEYRRYLEQLPRVKWICLKDRLINQEDSNY